MNGFSFGFGDTLKYGKITDLVPCIEEKPIVWVVTVSGLEYYKKVYCKVFLTKEMAEEWVRMHKENYPEADHQIQKRVIHGCTVKMEVNDGT